MAGAVPTIGYHFSEKELLKEKVGIFYPGACVPELWCPPSWKLYLDDVPFFLVPIYLI